MKHLLCQVFSLFLFGILHSKETESLSAKIFEMPAFYGESIKRGFRLGVEAGQHGLELCFQIFLGPKLMLLVEDGRQGGRSRSHAHLLHAFVHHC